MLPQLTLLVQCGMTSFILNFFSNQLQCSHVFLIIQFPESSNLIKTIVLYCRRNARFPVHSSPPRKFQECAARFLIRPDSNYNQMRANVEWSPNQSKELYPIYLSIEQSRKLWGFRNSAGRFCISILPKYCSSALTAHAYKMVITAACVQIGNCFCNTWIVVH